MAYRRWILAPVLLGISLLASGCTREMYRKSADEEVYCVVSEKSNDPRWNLQNYTIDVDPRSRFYDGFDPDHEPLPPDDPAAHEFMHEVDGMKGYPRWHCNGDTPFTENPEWMAFLPRDEQGRIQVDLNNSVRIGLLHSREYQRELEDLYLSALDVTFERFRFDVQFFATNDTFYTADGPIRPGSGATGQSSSRLTNDLNLSAQKLSATGGQYMVDLANSLVWQFSGPDTHAASTLLDFSLVQPLLRGGTRARVLERLTLSERVLLGNVRLMERYRSGFYVQITTGRDPGSGPARRGGAFGGAGLSGFTGLAGGFGRVANTNTNTGSGNTGAAGGAGAGQAGGFLGLIQTQQQLRNQEANVAALSDSLAQLQAAYDAGRIDRFQVDFGRQALYNARSQLLTSKTTFQNAQDAFKLTLGLPPHLEFKIDDPMLEPFQLIDPAIPTMQNQLTDIQESLGESIVNLRDTLDQNNNQANGVAVVAQELAQLRKTIATAGRVQTDSLRHIAKVKLDVDDILTSLPERKETYEILKTRGISAQSRTAEDVLLATNPNTPDNATNDKSANDDPGSEARRVEAAKMAANQSNDAGKPKNEDEFDRMLRDLEKLPRELTEGLRALIVKIQQYPAHFQAIDAELAALQNTPQDLAAPNGRLRLNKVLEKIPDLIVELSSDVLELSLIQARAKAESVTLLPLQLQACDALAIASKNRRDWMNARAALVDTWRLIEFNANELLSTFNVVLGGDISTVGDNPVDFRSATGRLRVGMQFDAPLTRVAERNNYRQALIEYQQARRDYYAFVDRVSQVLRTSVRQVELDQANFELRRAAVRVAIDQVEVSRLKLREPPKPGVETTASNPTIARDLVSSLADLLNVQNDFMSVWVNFEVERMNLDFNMDTMQVDAEGLWIDPGKNIGKEGLMELLGHPGDEEEWDRAVNEGRERIPTPEPTQGKNGMQSKNDRVKPRNRSEIQQTTFESEEEIEQFVKPHYQTARSQNTRIMNSQNRAAPQQNRASNPSVSQAKPANQSGPTQSYPTQPRAGSVAAPRAGSVGSN